MEKKKKPKFQVGDRVKLVRISFDDEGQAGGDIGHAHDRHLGTIHTIKSVYEGLHKGVERIGYQFPEEVDGFDYIFDERGLKRVRKAKPIPDVPDAIVGMDLGGMPLVPAPIPTAEKKKAPAKKKEEVFPDLRKELKEKSLVTPNTGRCSYGVQSKDGKITLHIGDICHARLGEGGVHEVSALALEIERDFVKLDKEGAIMLKRYSEYILNYSPWSPCFQRHGFENAFKYGILMNIDKCVEELAGAAVALREGSEFPEKTRRFCNFLDMGFSGNVSYLLSAFFFEYEDGMHSLNHLTAGHSILHSCMNRGALFKFFKKGYYLTNDRAPYRASPKRYDGISKWVAPNMIEADGSIGWFMSKEVEVPVPGAWGAKTAFVTKEVVIKLANKLEKLVNNF